ncbi:MAG TPA: nucleotidyltransferase domain-containing protein [Candidatus Methylomirabilis sp.]|nr:nucleotidyltransferase domain-containing protein [Candidatus Methylomirabilis sp.]
MRPRTQALRRPLDQVFAAPSHLAVCRALLDTAEGMSGRRVAREARINHQTCAVALGRLEELGVVRRQGSGQSQLFRLNRESALVGDLLIPLLKKEREVFPRIVRRMGEMVADRCLRALVFGSVARGEERRDSDLDLLLIADGPRGQGITHRAADDARAALAREWGLRVNAIVLTQRSLERRRERKDPLIINILREGIEVWPRSQGQGRRIAAARTATTD